MKALNSATLMGLLLFADNVFSQDLGAVRKAPSKPYFDSINPYISISQRHNVFNESGKLSNITNLQTLYEVGASLTKGKWGFSGSYYLMREKGYIPEISSSLRPELWAHYTAAQSGNWTTTFSGAYIPVHDNQDDFGALAAELLYVKSLSLAAGTVSLRWDNDARVDVNHEKEYLSVDGESMRTADTPGYIFTSSVELSYSPKDFKI